jgi:cytochrome P450
MRRLIAQKRARPGDGQDMLAILLAAHDEDGSQFTEDDLLANVMLLFSAGHETTANALTWTLFLLAQHSAVMANLYDELDGHAPDGEELQRLPLLEQVIQESMRRLPAVPWIPRVVARPVEMGGYLCPAGTEVIVSLYHTHRISDLYTEPQRFRPERWQTAQPGPYGYAPFAAGSRTCIGASFAMVEMKIVLAMILQRFRLEPVPNHKVDRLITATLAPKGELPMVVRQDGQWQRGAESVRGNIRQMVTFPDTAMTQPKQLEP